MDWKDKVYYTDLPDEIRQNVKTARQWAMLGMIPLTENDGKDLYSNRFRSQMYHYYHSSEVRAASPEELETLREPEREQRRRREQERREQRQREEEQRYATLWASCEKAQKDLQEIQKNYLELCQCIGAACRHDNALIGERSIVIDAETTGFSPAMDEILQLSIIDAETEDVLFCDYIRPFCVMEWPEAQAVNRISPAMVADKPFLVERLPEIQRIIDAAHTIIGYNVGFDVSFLEMSGISIPETMQYCDVMQEFAPIYGSWDEFYQDYTWQSLSVCADFFGYDWGESRAHDSLADCRATLYCKRKMSEKK